MTDFNHGQFTRKTKGSASWSGIVVVFLIIILSFAFINGLAKIRSKNNVDEKIEGKSWDGKSPFVFLLGDKQDHLAIFQKDPKKLTIFDLGSDEMESDLKERLSLVSKTTGIAIKDYIAVDEVPKFLNDFQSILTPIKIAFGGFGQMNTNISRYQAMRLWWQAKSVQPKQVNLIDYEYEKNVADDKVLGVTSSDLNRVIKPYTENINIVSDDIDVSIVDATGDSRVGFLLKTFISTEGGRVVEINTVEEDDLRCEVKGSEGYTRDYLAKLFNCDINDGIYGESLGKNLTITIGKSFAQDYF